MSITVDLGVLDDVAAQLVDAGVRSASTDPAKVNTPGVFIACGPIEVTRLDGGQTITAQLHLVVGDNGVKRSRDALIELLNKVLTVVTPDGPMTPQAIQLPKSPKPLPGLIVPVNIETGA